MPNELLTLRAAARKRELGLLDCDRITAESEFWWVCSVAAQQAEGWLEVPSDKRRWLGGVNAYWYLHGWIAANNRHRRDQAEKAMVEYDEAFQALETLASALPVQKLVELYLGSSLAFAKARKIWIPIPGEGGPRDGSEAHLEAVIRLAVMRLLFSILNDR